MRLATFCSHLHSQCILLTGGAQNRTDQYLLSLGVKYGQDVALVVSAVLFSCPFNFDRSVLGKTRWCSIFHKHEVCSCFRRDVYFGHAWAFVIHGRRDLEWNRSFTSSRRGLIRHVIHGARAA